MKLWHHLLPIDQELLQRELDGFVPREIYDIHVHFVTDAVGLEPHLRGEHLGGKEYLATSRDWFPGRQTNALVFGFPSRNNDRAAINRWVAAELHEQRASGSHRGLVLVAPGDDREEVKRLLQHGGFVGLKPYHLYAAFADTSQAKIEDFTPEWMWQMCHELGGILMLHIMRDEAIADAENISTLQRLCRKYPNCRVILAHIARSFSYRKARKGLRAIADLDNVWVDTAAVTESETFRCALELLGPKRIMYGSDYPITLLRGRCIATGDTFTWLYPPETEPGGERGDAGMTLIGIESLLCLREAAEDCRLRRSDIHDIFSGNAKRLLGIEREPIVPPGG